MHDFELRELVKEFSNPDLTGNPGQGLVITESALIAALSAAYEAGYRRGHSDGYDEAADQA